jgi:hypothetical protein
VNTFKDFIAKWANDPDVAYLFLGSMPDDYEGMVKAFAERGASDEVLDTLESLHGKWAARGAEG